MFQVFGVGIGLKGGSSLLSGKGDRALAWSHEPRALLFNDRGQTPSPLRASDGLGMTSGIPSSPNIPQLPAPGVS